MPPVWEILAPPLTVPLPAHQKNAKYQLFLFLYLFSLLGCPVWQNSCSLKFKHTVNGHSCFHKLYDGFCYTEAFSAYYYYGSNIDQGFILDLDPEILKRWFLYTENDPVLPTRQTNLHSTACGKNYENTLGCLILVFFKYYYLKTETSFGFIQRRHDQLSRFALNPFHVGNFCFFYSICHCQWTQCKT